MWVHLRRAYRFRSRGPLTSRRLALPRDDLPPDFFENHPVTARAEGVPRRLRAPDVVKLCVGMAAVQQLVQICQHRAEVFVIPMPKRRRRQALERFQFRTLGVDTPDDLFELFRNLHAKLLGEPELPDSDRSAPLL